MSSDGDESSPRQEEEPPAPVAVPPAEAFAVMGGSAVDCPLPGEGGGASDGDDGVASPAGSDAGGGGAVAPESGGIERSAHDLSPRWERAAGAAAQAPAGAPPLVTEQSDLPPPVQTPVVAPGGVAAPPPPPPHSHLHHHGAFGPTLYPRPEDAASHITVSDPITNTEGMNKKYISYRVEVHPHNRGADGDAGNGGNVNGGRAMGGLVPSIPRSAVQRRYKDFHWLASQLRRERPGAIVPPLPDKQAVSRFDPEFVEERRCGLERFLRRAAVHPELRHAECLNVFLTADDLTFHAAKNKKSDRGGGAGGGQQAQSPVYGDGAPPDSSTNIAPVATNAAAAAVPGSGGKKKNKLKNWFQETTTALSRDLVQSPDDHLFDEIQRYVDDLEKAVKKCHHESDRLVKKRREENSMFIDLGKALGQLSAAEGGVDVAATGGLGRPAAMVADASNAALAPLCSDAAESELHKFAEPFADHLRTLASVRMALQKRQDRRVTYSTALHAVTAKNAAMMKLRGGANANNASVQMKLYDAELSLTRAQQAANEARMDYESVTGRVLREVDRFKSEGARNVRATLAEYCAVQAEFHRRMEGAWGQLVPRLGEIDLDAGVPASTVGAAAAPAVPSGGAMGGAAPGVPGGMPAAGVPPAPLSTPHPHVAPHQGGHAMIAPHQAAMPPPQANGSSAMGAPPVQNGSLPLDPNVAGGAAAAQGQAMVGGMQYRDTTGIDWSS